MKAYWGVDVQLHAFFDLGTRWMCVVSFAPRPLYPPRENPWYLLAKVKVKVKLSTCLTEHHAMKTY
jgi:hypothetical protein